MWRWIAEQKQIREISSEQITWAAEFERRLAKARADGTKDLHALEDQFNFELGQYEDGIREIETKRLVRAARRLSVPIMHGPTHWDVSVWTMSRLLSPHGYHELRKAVRDERAARRTEVISWLSALTGLGGVIVGILALIYKK